MTNNKLKFNDDKMELPVRYLLLYQNTAPKKVNDKKCNLAPLPLDHPKRLSLSVVRLITPCLWNPSEEKLWISLLFLCLLSTCCFLVCKSLYNVLLITSPVFFDYLCILLCLLVLNVLFASASGYVWSKRDGALQIVIISLSLLMLKCVLKIPWRHCDLWCWTVLLLYSLDYLQTNFNSFKDTNLDLCVQKMKRCFPNY